MKYIIIPLLFFLSACGGKGDIIPNFQRYDHQLHAGAGSLVAITNHSLGGSARRGCLASIGVGIGKEVADSFGLGTPEVGDAVATGVSGCLTAYILRFKW